MSKIDNLFLRVLADEQLAREFDVNMSRINDLDDGKKSLNPQVRAIAVLLDQLNKRIALEKNDMNIHNKKGPVTLTDADFQPIYKKIVALLSK